MAIEREGLDYRIQVEDFFTNSLREFRARTQEARQGWAELKGELANTKKGFQEVIAAARGLRSLNKQVTDRSGEDVRRAAARAAAAGKEVAARRELIEVVRRQQALQKAADSSRQREVRRAREEVENVRAILAPQKQVTEAIRRRTEAEKASQRTIERSIALSRTYTKELGRQVAALDRLAAQSARAPAVPVPGLGAGGGRAARGVATGATQEAVAVGDLSRRVRALKKDLLDLDRGLTLPGAARGRAGLTGLRGDMLGLGTATERTTFRFERLVAIFGGFLALRRVAGLLRQAVTEGIRFNASVENSVLGIQSILVATGRVADAQGNLVTGAEAFAAAQAEATKQVAQLRVEGLRTAATYDQLLETFQTALGVGLAQGLTVDQIRQFAVRVSQAAAAIDLPQNQLAEEIRSILQGTITARTTRIAVALGISNEDIARAKEAGNLADFLVERFQAFEEAGNLALGNYTTIVSNLKDAVGQLLGEGTKGLFDDIKATLQEITNELVTQSEKGVIINPDAVAVVRAFADGLRQALAEGRELATSLSLDDAVTAADVLGKTIGGVARVLRDVGTGFVQGLRDASRLAQGAANALGLDATTAQDLSEILRNATRLLTVALGVRLAFRGFLLPITLTAQAFKTLFSTLGIVLSPLVKIVSLIRSARASTLLLLGPFTLIAGAIGLAVATFRNDFIRSIDIGGLKIGTLVDLFKNNLTFAIKRVAAFFETGWTVAVAAVRVVWVKAINFFADIGLAVIEALLKGAAFFTDKAKGLLNEVQAARKVLNKAADEDVKRTLAQGARRLAQIDAEVDAAKKLREENEARIKALDKVGPRRTVKEAFQEAVDGILGAADAVDSRLLTGLDQSAVRARTLRDAMRDVGVAILQNTDAIEGQADAIKRAVDQADKASDALKFSKATQGLDGIAREIAKVFDDSATAFREASRELNRRAEESTGRIAALDAEEARIRREAEQVQLAGAGRIPTGADLLRAQLPIAKKLLELEQELSVLGARRVSIQQQLAGSQGDEADRLRENLRLVTKSIAETEANLTRFSDASDRSLSAFGGSKDAIERIVEASRRLVEIQRDRRVSAQAIADLDQRIADAREQFTRAQITEAARLASEEAARLSASRETLEAQLRFEERRLDISRRRIVTDTDGRNQEIADISARIGLEEELLTFETRRRQLQINDLRERAATIDDQSARADVERLIDELLAEQNLKLREAQILIRGLGQERQALELQNQDQGLFTGIQDALKRFADDNKNFDQAGTTIGQSIGESLSATISSTLTAAFNPNSNQGLGESIAEIGTQLLNTIIDALTRAAVAKFILSPLGLANGGGVGFAEGGDIPNSPQLAGRPGGLDSRDTVPIWAQPGEWMMRVAAVRKYGRDVMEAINRGAIDASELRGLVGLRSTINARRRARAGYADGGEILVAARTSQQPKRRADGGGGGGVLPTLVADEQMMDRILAGGGGRAMRRWLRDNGDYLRHSSGSDRGGSR